MLVSKIIERLDVDVDLAADGAEALEKLSQGRYGIVVLDLMMPKVSGFDVLNEFKLRPPNGVKCVIVMSAIGRQLRSADRDIVCAVVEKPFDIGKVKAAVAECLDGHSSP